MLPNLGPDVDSAAVVATDHFLGAIVQHVERPPTGYRISVGGLRADDGHDVLDLLICAERGSNNFGGVVLGQLGGPLSID